MKILWPSPSKINLFLYINNKRNDKYHNIQTLFQFLNFGDLIKIKINKTGKICLSRPIKNIINKKNLVLKSANLLKKYAIQKNLLSEKDGATILIKKKIPIGGGMGGGSSNAATTLIVLNFLWKINFSLKYLSYIGLKIGSDVPAFIIGKTSIVKERGNKIYPIKNKKTWYIIINPQIKISTSKIFNRFKIKNQRHNLSINKLMNYPFTNDFEKIIRKKFKVIDKLINFMSNFGSSRLTGTGSCIFTKFDSKKKAIKAIKLIPNNVKSFLAYSTNYSILHKFLKSIKNKKLK
ncbi:4-(cytidine 5'-diphospho)-2-C-methyl-D-erythritol kinase [Buchnera aphidicola (Neophyllaphis varicolor)]|uniref:4-(cytidine 5'-diphospho)-2-C-methyl-D-erythritol kinase n=1 Tax=Buchnera aphidicola TaxID=9 RepID=UPI0031B82CA1